MENPDDITSEQWAETPAPVKRLLATLADMLDRLVPK